MSACDHCGDKATESWTLDPCALDKRLKGKLCAPCDVALNSLVLAFFGVPKRKAIIRRYRTKGPTP